MRPASNFFIVQLSNSRFLPLNLSTKVKATGFGSLVSYTVFEAVYKIQLINGKR